MSSDFFLLFDTLGCVILQHHLVVVNYPILSHEITSWIKHLRIGGSTRIIYFRRNTTQVKYLIVGKSPALRTYCEGNLPPKQKHSKQIRAPCDRYCFVSYH